MKKLAFLAWLFFAAATQIHGQAPVITTGAPNPKTFSGAPTGTCGPQDTAVNTSNGDFYSCSAAAWVKVSSAGGGGLADPGSNGIVKRTALNTTAVSTSTDVVGLFTGCSGTQYLGADGACHAAGTGAATSFQQLAADPGSPTEGTVWENTTTKLAKGFFNAGVRLFYTQGVTIALADLPTCSGSLSANAGACTLASGNAGIGVAFSGGVATVSNTGALLSSNTFTGVQLLPNGSAAAPSLAFANVTNSGLYVNAGNGAVKVSTNGADSAQFFNGFTYSNVYVADFAHGDVGFSRDSAGVMDLGNGGAQDKSGTLKLANIIFGCAPVNGTVYANFCPGADAGAQIAAAQAALPTSVNGAFTSGGGTIDARGYACTDQTISSELVLGTPVGSTNTDYRTTLLVDGCTQFKITVPGFALSAAATASGGNTVYTGTNLAGIPVNAIVNISGFVNSGNNCTTSFNNNCLVVSSTSTTITVVNAGGVAETHAATLAAPAIVLQGDGSAIIGQTTGFAGAGAGGNFHNVGFNTYAGADISSILQANIPRFRLEYVAFNVNGGTVTNTIVTLMPPSDSGNVKDIWIAAATNVTGMLIRGLNGAGGVGGVTIENPDINCGALAGCTPMAIKGIAGGGFLAGVNIIGGTLTHMGVGLPGLLIDDQGSGDIQGVNVNGTYIELSHSTDIGVSVIGGTGISVDNITCDNVPGAACVKSAQNNAAKSVVVRNVNDQSNCTCSVSINGDCVPSGFVYMPSYVSSDNTNARSTWQGLNNNQGTFSQSYIDASAQFVIRADEVTQIGAVSPASLTVGQDSSTHDGVVIQGNANNNAFPFRVNAFSGNTNKAFTVGPGSGKATWYGSTSGSAAIDVAGAAGTPNTILLPTATGAVGALLQTNGANPQQTSWIPFQSKRVSGCATGAAQFNTCDTTVTWTTAFADANYTATCVGDVATSGVPQLEGIDISAAKAGASITVRTIALTAAAAQFTTIDCMAIHD